MKNKIMVVCGPTASGKTFVSIELAKILDAEIVSADSMQIYKELNIGTAKPSAEETAGVPHHLIDIVSVGTPGFSVAEYVKRAGECVCGILGRNKRVILCGGTGLYIDHFMNNTEFTEYENDLEYRKELEKLPSDILHSMLVETDIKCSEAIHPNNKKRIIRALEIFKITGKTKSELDELANLREPKYDFVKLGLDFSDRSTLYDRINKRVDMMMANGLPGEVRRLYDLGEEDNIRRTGAIGYVELLDHFSGLCSFDEAAEKIKQHTRNYAKRQLTWFKKDPGTVWINAEADDSCEIIRNCLKFIKL